MKTRCRITGRAVTVGGSGRHALPVLLLVTLLAGCVTTDRSLPPKDLAPSPNCGADTALGKMAQGVRDGRADLSGIQVLDTGAEAFRARAALIEAATCSIDAQYYIWNSDASGRYLASRLLAAADRGVRVRVLLDDINVGDREGVLAAMDAHPNIEVQIYNPFAQRRGLGKAFNFLAEFTRLNRRMHIKSFTVDQSLTIVGGRNIGDEYFDAGAELNFRDRDLMVVGPVISDTVSMFDQFWNTALARPIGEIADGMAPPDAATIERRVAEAEQRMNALHAPLPRSQVSAIEDLEDAARQMVWAPARLIHDPPPSPDALGDSDRPQPGSLAIREVAQSVRAELLFESAYLVLDDETMSKVEQLHTRGIRVRALTNSLASNDVTANHAAYARRRARMLKSGVELYELRPDAPSCRQIIQNARACGQPHVFGLHAKTYVLDRKTVYVGSLNLNMRSRYLNAEGGLVIESPALAERIAADIEWNMQPANSWRVVLDEHGQVTWHEDGSLLSPQRIYQHEPRVGWARRLRSALIALLPLEKYL